MIEFTDEELDELKSLISDRLLYGDDEVVYMTTESGRLEHERLSGALRKVEDEAKERGRWWAR